MTDELLSRLQEARSAGEPCVLVTVAATRGSVPRAAGAKMLVFAGGTTFGTVGGGKFEALVIKEAATALGGDLPVLKTYPLHDGSLDSFGAICGGEVTVLLEPLAARERLVIVGAGHCAQAIAQLAIGCRWHVTVLDDRHELLLQFPEVQRRIGDQSPADFIREHRWGRRDALLIVSRNYEIDQAALGAALSEPSIPYIGMIGSRRKVRHVFTELSAQGVALDQLARVFAPIGLDIGADSPAEIALSVCAEILQVLRSRRGGHLRACAADSAPEPVLVQSCVDADT